MVHSEIIKLNPGDATADRGVKRARFVVIKQNVLPAILVEGGFVSNHMEAARVNRSDYRQALAQDIARGVIRFANSMGDRHTPLPGNGGDQSSPAPKAIPVVPVAPAGLAHDPANGKIKGKTPATSSAGANTTVPSAKATTSTTQKSKKNKNKKTAAAPDTSKPVPMAPAPALAPVPPPSAPQEGSKPVSSGAALNLAEPATPTPAPGADKAPPEPDEPPTVNASPTSSTPPSSNSSGSTNASSSAAPSPSKEP
jgi:hypothetical protein